MTFTEAVTTAFQKYATFSGRATRSEYWWFVLFVILVNIVLTIVANALNSPFLPAIASLLFFLPNLAITARRLHDIDKAGWWMLIVVVPLLGFILMLIWTCTKGTLGENRFGPPQPL